MVDGGVQDGERVLVDRADFDANTVGIHVRNYTQTRTCRNTFNLGNGAGHVINSEICDQNIGIYTERSTKFLIEENIFRGVSNPNSNWERIGLLNEWSDKNDNIVYKNQFVDLPFACKTLANFDLYYLNGGVEQCRKLISSIFPEKQVFEKNQYRTGYQIKRNGTNN